MKRAALYLRVSTIDQTTANQERELRQVATILLTPSDSAIKGGRPLARLRNHRYLVCKFAHAYRDAHFCF